MDYTEIQQRLAELRTLDLRTARGRATFDELLAEAVARTDALLEQGYTRQPVASEARKPSDLRACAPHRAEPELHGRQGVPGVDTALPTQATPRRP